MTTTDLSTVCTTITNDALAEGRSEPVQLAIRSFGEPTRIHPLADLHLPAVRQPWIRFKKRGCPAGLPTTTTSARKNMEFAVPPVSRSEVNRIASQECRIKS